MRLQTRIVEKPWGRDVLPPSFESKSDGPGGKRIGEIWFEPPQTMPDLLVKYLFTSEKLSVQCHPNDAQTKAMGLGRQGKEECWLVIEAQAGAKLGIGFERTLSRDELRAAALDGSIEQLLTWHEVREGDFFYIPANTVHAIGKGCSIIEIQQNSDITYRLYDYGRPRELHLDKALAVAARAPYPASLHRHAPDSGHAVLVDGPHFRLDIMHGAPSADIAARYRGPLIVIARDEPVRIGDACVVSPGQCGLASSLEAVQADPAGRCLIAQTI